MNFAKNEMVMIAVLLFQQFDLELLTHEIGFNRGLGASRPEKTFVRYERKPVSELVKQEIIDEAVSAGCPHIKKVIQTE